MREIKFRAWDEFHKKMFLPDEIFLVCGEWVASLSIDIGEKYQSGTIMQFTGLRDKNGIKDVYEGDIIDENGVVKGNIHESTDLDKGKTDLVVPPITSEDWQTAYMGALGRGCRHAERYANTDAVRKLDKLR